MNELDNKYSRYELLNYSLTITNDFWFSFYKNNFLNKNIAISVIKIKYVLNWLGRIFPISISEYIYHSKKENSKIYEFSLDNITNNQSIPEELIKKINNNKNKFSIFDSYESFENFIFKKTNFNDIENKIIKNAKKLFNWR